MRGLLRSSPGQEALSTVLAAYLWLMEHTVRWSYRNLDAVKPLFDGEEGLIVCLWHSRIAGAMATVPMVRHRPPKTLVSPSDDGEFIARALGKLGLPTFRGSTQRSKDPRRKRLSGATAYRQAAEWVSKGEMFVITPDGPRGPPEIMAAGAVRMAIETGAPVVLIGVAARPCARAGSWDRTMLPMPFARGLVVYDDPVRAPPGADVDGVPALIADWSARLTRVTEAAEAGLS